MTVLSIDMWSTDINSDNNYTLIYIAYTDVEYSCNSN